MLEKAFGTFLHRRHDFVPLFISFSRQSVLFLSFVTSSPSTTIFLSQYESVNMSDLEVHSHTQELKSTTVISRSSTATVNDSEESAQPQSSYLSGFVLSITLLALCIATFCVALDNTIISTAIPRITDEFHSLSDVGWYGSGW